MADNITVTAGTGTTVAMDEVTDATLGSCKVQYVKLMDGTLNGTDKALIDSSGLKVNLGADNDVTITGSVTVDGSGSTQPVSAASLPLPTGASTSANQTTIIGHVDGIETLLGTIDTDTSDIATDTGTIASDTTSIDGKITACNTGAVVISSGSVTADTELPAAAALADAAANPTTPSVGVNNLIWNGTTWDRIKSVSSADTGDGTGLLGTAMMAENAGSYYDLGMLYPSTDGQGVQNSLAVSTYGYLYNGATWDRAKGDLTNGALVNLGANNDVTVTSGAITETNSGAIKTAVETIDNAINGTEMQVDVVASLPAGTNAIGKLSANSGVDIGDVDVTSTSIDNSINGAGAPTIDSYASAAISASADTANQSLVAAPGASKQIWVYGIQFTAGTGDGSASFQDEDDTAISGVMPFAEYSGMAISPTGNYAMPIWKVATNKALEVDTVTCDIKGSIQYAIVSV